MRRPRKVLQGKIELRSLSVQKAGRIAELRLSMTVIAKTFSVVNLL